jgi:plastocyanin
MTAHPLWNAGAAVVRIAFAAAVLALPAAFAQSQAAVRNVGIDKAAYLPQEITVAPGTRVVWTNHDEMPHTVTSSDKVFVSKGLDTDDKFDYTFAREGDFAYHCAVHPYMTGIVHVRK